VTKHGNRPQGLRYWTPAPGVRGQQAERDQGLIARSVELAITAAGAEVQTGGMIALIPDNPQAFTVPGGDPAGQMHMTLCFLGDVSDLDDETKEQLAKRVQILAADNGPIQMRVQGVGIWNRDGGDTGDREPSTNTLLQPSNPAMLIRDYADMIGREALGARYPEQFQPWAPHICAGYSLDPGKLPTHDGMVRFSKIRLALAGEDQDFLLAGPERLSDEETAAPSRFTKDGVVEMADTKTAPAEAPVVGKPDANGKVPAFFPCLAIEGMETADGRFIEVGALELRTPPLTLWAQTTNTGQGGHSGAVVTGRLDEAWKIPGPEFISRQTGKALPEGTYVWQARGEVNGDTEAGQMFVDKYLRGNSIDLSEVTAYDDIQFEDDGTEKHRVVVEKGFISASTLCAIPAFPDAFAEIEGEEGGYSAPLEELGEEFPKTLEGLADFLRSKGIQPVVASVSIPELGDACSECLASGEELGTLPPALRKKADAKKKAADDAEDAKDGGADEDTEGDDGKPAFLKRKIGAAKGGKASAKTASAGRSLPPLEWFTDPGLSEPTPLQIDPDTGRVFGHIATWGTCHIGVSRRCTPPPKSPSDYAYFNVGALRALDDAGEVRTVGVGHLTMNTGHASLSASLADTLAHYDNTGTVAADLAAGEDAHGIWVAGRLRPELSETQVHALMASAPSGDWRPVDGKLDLAAVLAVNVPGYPVPRARVASGAGEPEIVALVAAGATRPATDFGPDGLDLDAFADRVSAKIVAALAKIAPEVIAADPSLAEQQEAATLAFEQQALALEFDELAPAGITDAELAEVVDAWTAAFPDLIASGEFAATEFNWVDKVGGLPKFIKRIVKHLSAKGMDKSRAIATAVNVVKKMCASGDTNFPGKQNVNAGSRAEACGAVADWERKKAQSHAD
jgi:2'-5' RNA ligase